MIRTELYLITDREASGERSVPELVQAAIAGGLKLVQYREKKLAKRETLSVAQVLRTLTQTAGVTLIINDDLDLAMAVGADGVHLGQEDLPVPVARKVLGADRIIGVSVRDTEAARRAIQEGADYLAVGPIYKSSTKLVRPPLGVEIIQQVRNITDLPLFGIGGIDPSNACAVVRAGADGIAAISSLHRASDVTTATREFLKLLKKCKKDART